MRGEIELRSVSFSYGREPVLDDLSFRIEAGQTVALVGPTGAGKSTIAALIPRLMDVDAGQRARRRRRRARPRAGVAPAARSPSSSRTPCCSTARCATTSCAGTPARRDRDVERAARLALVDEFAAGCPTASTPTSASAAPTCRAASASAWPSPAPSCATRPIVILDEPTSALDAASEELLVAASTTCPPGGPGSSSPTACRRSATPTRSSCSTRGRLVESGTHDELVRGGGLYARLANFQSRDRRLDDRAAGTVLTLPHRTPRRPAFIVAGALEPTAPPAPGR